MTKPRARCSSPGRWGERVVVSSGYGAESRSRPRRSPRRSRATMEDLVPPAGGEHVARKFHVWVNTRRGGECAQHLGGFCYRERLRLHLDGSQLPRAAPRRSATGGRHQAGSGVDVDRVDEMQVSFARAPRRRAAPSSRPPRRRAVVVRRERPRPYRSENRVQLEPLAEWGRRRQESIVDADAEHVAAMSAAARAPCREDDARLRTRRDRRSARSSTRSEFSGCTWRSMGV